MAITQGICSTFLVEALRGLHQLEEDDIRIALFTSAADIGPHTTRYAETALGEGMAGEVTGNGYPLGGVSLEEVRVDLYGDTACVAVGVDPTWVDAQFTTRGALIYNASSAGRAIAVLDFGADKTVGPDGSGDYAVFRVEFPPGNSEAAVIRIGAVGGVFVEVPRPV